MNTFRHLTLVLMLVMSICLSPRSATGVKKRSITVGASLSFGMLKGTLFVTFKDVEQKALEAVRKEIQAVDRHVARVHVKVEELSLKTKQYTSAERVIQVETELRTKTNAYKNILRSIDRLHSSNLTEAAFNESAELILRKLDNFKAVMEDEVPSLMFQLNSYIVGNAAAGASLTNGFYCDATEVALHQVWSSRTDNNSYDLPKPFKDGPLRQRNGLRNLQEFIISLHKSFCPRLDCQVQNEEMSQYLDDQDQVFESCLPGWLEKLVSNGSVSGSLIWKSQALALTRQAVNDRKRDDNGFVPAARPLGSSRQQRVTLEQHGSLYVLRLDGDDVTIHNNMQFGLKSDGDTRTALFRVTMNLQGNIALVETRFLPSHRGLGRPLSGSRPLSGQRGAVGLEIQRDLHARWKSRGAHQGVLPAVRGRGLDSCSRPAWPAAGGGPGLPAAPPGHAVLRAFTYADHRCVCSTGRPTVIPEKSLVRFSENEIYLFCCGCSYHRESLYNLWPSPPPKEIFTKTARVLNLVESVEK